MLDTYGIMSKMKRKETVPYTIQMPVELKKWIEEKAKEATTSGSAVVRQIITAYKNAEENQCSG